MDSDPGWRARVPELLNRCAERWSLELGEPLAGAYLAAVYGCIGPGGEDLVLKVSPPLAAPAIEVRALAHWAGNGAARLVAFDEAAGVLLLERVRPGTLLMDRDRSVPDDALAVRAASGALAAMQSVPAPRDGDFPTFLERLEFWFEWMERNGEPGTAGMALLPSFERCARSLDASTKHKTLAHGDFVAKNLLLADDGSYVAVDPLPFIGDAACDIGQFSAYHSPVATVIPRARAIARAAGIDPERAARWAALWMVTQATETWRDDSDDIQGWVQSEECHALLRDAESAA